MKEQLRSKEIWLGEGVEVYREGRESTLSISFQKRLIPSVISFLHWGKDKGYYQQSFEGTLATTTKTTIKFEDYQGRKLSIYKREIPEMINSLGKWVK